MAKTIHRENSFRNQERKASGQGGGWIQLVGMAVQDERIRLGLGLFLLISAFSLMIAFISYLFSGANDQSVVEMAMRSSVKDSGKEVENWLGLTGAIVAHVLVFRWFGIASFLIVPVLFSIGWKLAFKTEIFPVGRSLALIVFFLFWISTLMGYFFENNAQVNFWSGGIGFEIAVFLQSLIGIGTFFVLMLALVLFVNNYFDWTEISAFFTEKMQQGSDMLGQMRKSQNQAFDEDDADEEQLSTPFTANTKVTTTPETEQTPNEAVFETPKLNKTQPPKSKRLNLELEITPDSFDEEADEVANPGKQAHIEFDPNAVEQDPFLAQVTGQDLVNESGQFDPTLELAHYRMPTLDLLNEYTQGKRQVTNEELEANKDRIVETLSNYGIGISQIKATIGPTVTLYEIIPEAGVRISKIKSLEDDIALSLSALGIRIIAPIPGKGTIGIEVPNKRREVVGMRTVLMDEAFTDSEKDLPIILGKTISNEVFVADLAKMPHLLIAGATGQGKSVGLNTFMVSLLYKKHPSELKFVLVDPKKVEMTLYNTIERHFLARLPGEEEAIITDNKKVIHTLHSLCIEMENRYNLLKEAGCRNLKEYNRKFQQRRLNPRKGHFFMPYIVLVIDELADLMMTAGKEVEQPIARLAQLARAVGIHLIVATQRPSVNVITGIIKANFPARLSFKVTSKIDSRTILDSGGAEQLVGMGDMLFSMGSEVIRLQGAFLDTPEVESICEYIGGQQGYQTPYELPEYVTEEERNNSNNDEDFDSSERDALFEEAARIIVMHQQGSTSLLQRRLKLGYNRAGRLIDQLEKAGIVGPFEGSKAREVLIPDEYSLERLLNSMNK